MIRLVEGSELGAYRIVRLIGQGGMGGVYEATHTQLGKRVAIKTMHNEVTTDPEAAARFVREGRAASRIRHPNAVDVFDVAIEGEVAYLVMEFLEGETSRTASSAPRLYRSRRPSTCSCR